MKVIGNSGQMPEEWIRDDVHEIIVQTGRMPKLVYLMNRTDAANVILRTGAEVGGRLELFQLYTECGPVDIVVDVSCPVGDAYRMYRCPCGALFSDDSSHSGKCVNCMMARAAEQIEALGSKPDHWNLDADMRARLSGAKLAEPGAGSFDYAKAMRAMEISRDLGAANRLHDRGVYQSPPFSIGDPVRWWPDGHDDGQALVDRYIDGTVTTMRPLCIKITGSHGFSDRVMFGYLVPAHGGVVDTSVSPGTVQRLNPGTPPKPPTVKTPWMRVGAPCDPLDVEYDGVKLRELLNVDDRIRREAPIGDQPLWFRVADGFTAVQRAAVSAHWSAELRAKVKAGAAEDKARAPSVMVDHED